MIGNRKVYGVKSAIEQTITVVGGGGRDMETRVSIAVVDVKHLSFYTLIPRTALNPLSSPPNKGVNLLGQETQPRGWSLVSDALLVRKGRP